LEKINNLARKHSERAIHLLLAAMDDENANWTIRVRAAELLLDRAIGKPITPTEIKVEGDVSVQHLHLLAVKEIAGRRLETLEAVNSIPD